MPATPDLPPSQDHAITANTGRCTQCGGNARLWADRWACTECGYFEFVRQSIGGFGESLEGFEETETFEHLVEKAHFWSRHAHAGSGTHKLEALSHAALYMSRALKLVAARAKGT